MNQAWPPPRRALLLRVEAGKGSGSQEGSGCQGSGFSTGRNRVLRLYFLNPDTVNPEPSALFGVRVSGFSKGRNRVLHLYFLNPEP